MNKHGRNEYIPDSVSLPGETLLETIETLGMTQVELAKRTGRPEKTISEIINGKTAISPETALQLEKVLNIPAHFWMNREQRYREFLARQEERKRFEANLEWLKEIPVRAMIKMGWIHLYKDKVDQLREVLSFFGVATPEQWKNIWLSRAAAYRQSPAFKNNPAAIAAWMRRGELEAQAIQCKPYDSARFGKTLRHIRALTGERAETFLPKLIDFCAVAGVAVVFVPELPETHVYGVTRWVSPTKAIVQLSLRGKTNDQLWFTFFHETFHILHHGKREIFIEAKGTKDEKEREADNFSADYLIPQEKWTHFRTRSSYNTQIVREFAAHIGIAPGIVIGRLQHEGLIPFNRLNNLKIQFAWKRNSE